MTTLDIDHKCVYYIIQPYMISIKCVIALNKMGISYIAKSMGFLVQLK